VSKPDFRHWADSVDLQLEAVHNFVFPDLVLEKVKRLTSEVTEASLGQIIAKINEEHKKKEGAKRVAENGHPPGLPGTDPWAEGRLAGHMCPDLIPPESWEFTAKTRWLYTYVLGKLNAELHGKTIGIEGKNGLEMYRQICNIIDAVPENYKFYLDSQFISMPQVYGDKVKSLKDLYQFRVLLKSKVVAYKKAIGVEPDASILKQILWVCMDVSSKQLASHSGLDHKNYDEI
jgi:hypothetical protein